MKSKSSTFILIVVILLVVGGLGYFFLVKGDSASTSQPTGLVSTNTGKQTGTAVATTGKTGDQVVSLLRNLSTIQLSDALFQNPSFGYLEDISIALPPVTNQGRRNPFSSVGTDATVIVGGGSVTSSSVTSTPVISR